MVGTQTTKVKGWSASETKKELGPHASYLYARGYATPRARENARVGLMTRTRPHNTYLGGDVFGTHVYGV